MWWRPELAAVKAHTVECSTVAHSEAQHTLAEVGFECMKKFLQYRHSSIAAVLISMIFEVLGVAASNDEPATLYSVVK